MHGQQVSGDQPRSGEGLRTQIISQFRLPPRCEGRASTGNDFQRDKGKMLAPAPPQWAISVPRQVGVPSIWEISA